MPSKYRPQLLGWLSDLDKKPYRMSEHVYQLIYANDNYCAFIRLEDDVQSSCNFHNILTTILSSFIFFVMVIMMFDSGLSKETIVCIVILIIDCIALYLVIPELYKYVFSSMGNPIIFNRKTGKVYVNENYFFNFKVLHNPKVFLQPKKRRIQEYDWNDMHGVVNHNLLRGMAPATLLMVCQSGTNQVIDHVMLDPQNAASGRILIWNWVNSFMVFYKSIDIDSGKYKTDEEAKFKTDIIDGEGWPEWMVEAFNATSLEELAAIKQKYNIKP